MAGTVGLVQECITTAKIFIDVGSDCENGPSIPLGCDDWALACSGACIYQRRLLSRSLGNAG